MFVGHLGVLILIVVVIAITMLWLGVRLVRYRAPVADPGEAVGGDAGEQSGRSSAHAVRLPFLAALLIFGIGQAVALLLMLWALAFWQVGFTIGALFLLPVVVGFGQVWSRGAFRW